MVTNCRTEFAQGQVDPHEAGAMGGKSSGSGESDDYESGSTGNQGSAKGRMFFLFLVPLFAVLITSTEFAHGKVDPKEAGKKGGQTS
jgi:general stress protein YciG